MRYLAVLLLMLTACATLRAQVVQIQAGSSSIYNATGGSLNLFFPNSEMSFGAGIAQGKLVAGAADQFEFHSCQVTAGDKQLFFSGEGTGIALATRGLYTQCKRKKDKLAVFLSSCGATYSAPFYSALRTQHFCAGYDYSRTILPSLEISSFFVSEGSTSAIESARWHWKHILLAGGAGILTSNLFLNGSAVAQFTHFSASAQRQTTIFDGETFNTTSFSAGGMLGPVDLHGSEFMSKVNGYSVGTGIQESIFRFGLAFSHSPATSIISNTLTARINRHIQLTGSANDSRGHWSASYGGQWTSNLATLNVSHAIQFLPLRGFQQVLSASISLQLPHSVSLNASTVTLPNGSIKYSIFGGDYFQGPLSGAVARSQIQRPRGGKFVIRFCVKDENASPIEGAALMIGKEISVSDSTGCGYIHEKKDKPVSLHVSFEDFTANGAWEVVNAPEHAEPDTIAEITLRKKR